jgi:hypothetical protein
MATKAQMRELSADRKRPVIDPRKYGARCDDCPLRGNEYVMGDGPHDALIAFVGEAPGQNELRAGIPFIGKSGEWLEERLAAVGRMAIGRPLSRNEVLLDNAVACFPPGGDMRAFMQRAKKGHKDQQQNVLKDPFAADDEKVAARNSTFHSPIDCCRPRLMFSLGIPRCGNCGRWNMTDQTAVAVEALTGAAPELPKVSCTCNKPRWVKPLFKPVLSVVALGNAALESLRGVPGIQEKQMYVFENGEKK